MLVNNFDRLVFKKVKKTSISLFFCTASIKHRDEQNKFVISVKKL